MRGRLAIGVALLAPSLLAAAPSAVNADSFTPIRMTISVSRIARLDRPLSIRVTVSADPSALDARRGSIRAQVKLTGAECGGVYSGSTGTVLLNRAFNPQPSPGRAFSGSVKGSGRPSGYGVRTVCAFLDDDYQQLANDTNDIQVNVSRSCTAAADKLDRTLRQRHVRASVIRSERSAARRACGSGVAL